MKWSFKINKRYYFSLSVLLPCELAAARAVHSRRINGSRDGRRVHGRLGLLVLIVVFWLFPTAQKIPE